MGGFKELPQVQKIPKILNPGNKSQHRGNKMFRKIKKYLIQAISLKTDEIRSDNKKYSSLPKILH